MTSMIGNDHRWQFDETELRLGLPGAVAIMAKTGGKRGFSETMDFKLNMIATKEGSMDHKMIKGGDILKENGVHFAKPPPKTQVVGWPPIRSYRKNILTAQKNDNEENETLNGGITAAMVKVSMDGAPYLRKIDLKMYKSYQELSDALAKMFRTFTSEADRGAEGMIDFMKESKLMDVMINRRDYVPTYEDKDGDWMLVGDVPWEMFVESCNRLRIMKGNEAVGLAPWAMEKCKNTV